MWKWNLISKIEKYLSDEYEGEIPKPVLPSFRNYMKLNDSQDSVEDSSEEQVRASGKNVVEKRLMVPQFSTARIDVEKYIDDALEKVTFAKKLNQYMYEKDLTTGIIYQRCLVDRKLISKITTQEEYHPSKSTVFALCIGLQLSLPEGEEFLSLAGYGFNRSSKYDLIIKFMLENHIYDLDIINEMLMHFKQPCFE